MPARNKVEGKTFGRYHVIEFEGKYNYKRQGAFYKCIDMITGKPRMIRSDHLMDFQKLYEKQLRNIAAIENYKKQRGLK